MNTDRTDKNQHRKRTQDASPTQTQLSRRLFSPEQPPLTLYQDRRLRRLHGRVRLHGRHPRHGICRLTICSILVCICFSAKIPDELIIEIEEVLKEVMMISLPNLPEFLPLLTPLFRKQLNDARALRRRQLNCLVPLVRAMREFLQTGGNAWKEGEGDRVVGGVEMMSPPKELYVDSLFDLEPPGRGKQLGEEELVTLCSVVMSAATDTEVTRSSSRSAVWDYIDQTLSWWPLK